VKHLLPNALHYANSKMSVAWRQFAPRLQIPITGRPEIIIGISMVRSQERCTNPILSSFANQSALLNLVVEVVCPVVLFIHYAYYSSLFVSMNHKLLVCFDGALNSYAELKMIVKDLV
jgi:hypothetical protein